MKTFEKGIILSFDEVKILLYSMGIQEIKGIYMPEKIFSESEIVMALHHMSERGLIGAVETEFSIREDLLDMLRVMGNPDSTMVWRHEDMGETEYFCYIVPNQILVSERYWKKKNAVKLSMYTTEEFEMWRELVPYDNN